jgi:hypothetical protein
MREGAEKHSRLSIVASQERVERVVALSRSDDIFSFSDVFVELQKFQLENDGNLSIPKSHPAFIRILDILTGAGVESSTEERWNEQMSALEI